MSSPPKDEPFNPAEPASPREEIPLDEDGGFDSSSTVAESTGALASAVHSSSIESSIESSIGFGPSFSEASPPDPSGLTTDSDGLSPDWIEPTAPVSGPMLFRSFEPIQITYPARIPHFGHLSLVLVFALIGLLCTTLLTRSALQFHLFGISTLKGAVSDIHYTLGSMAILYLLTLLCSVVLFPLLWHKGFFAGVQWRAATAIRLRGRLGAVAFFCFLLALVSGWLMPGPSNAPIDKMFHTPSAAWLMFGFGVTFAPFFEETLFRGFLLPALCTAFDWTAEKVRHIPPPELRENGHPQWSLPAMVTASILTSAPFAYMHAEQTGYSLGPFVLLVCVSMILCWTRLVTRSLAASVMVHACYNFLLFSVMLLGTNGFRHLEKM